MWSPTPNITYPQFIWLWNGLITGMCPTTKLEEQKVKLLSIKGQIWGLWRRGKYHREDLVEQYDDENWTVKEDSVKSHHLPSTAAEVIESERENPFFQDVSNAAVQRFPSAHYLLLSVRWVDLFHSLLFNLLYSKYNLISNQIDEKFLFPIQYLIIFCRTFCFAQLTGAYYQRR